MNNVPVMLSNDRSSIVSYPDRKDLYYKGDLAYPTRLHDGFLLDNRGIGANVAFLSLTYETYSKLDRTPSLPELINLIIDKDPLTEMYQCGNRGQYSDPEKDLNDIIDARKFESCRKLK
jgi:hypothetical protein